MIVTQVSLKATRAATDAGCPELTPELLASVGARYSRNDEGLHAILSRVEGMDSDSAVDAIFKHLDYGHASIADMVPVALFIDSISIYMAYKLWALCPLAGGQETSTRYVKLKPEGVLSASEAGLLPHQVDMTNPQMKPFTLPFTQIYDETISEMFTLYTEAHAFWESYAEEYPSAVSIPDSLQDDEKAIARIRRNFAFDRARYFLPLAAKTNVMMIQSAREWARLIMHLRSMPLLEAQDLGDALEEGLLLSAPRLARHCKHNPDISSQYEMEWQELRLLARTLPQFGVFAPLMPQIERYRAGERRPGGDTPYYCSQRDATVEVSYPCTDRSMWEDMLVRSLAHRKNRYSPPSSAVCRTQVRFAWESVSFAEIRDLNRHRTGTKYCPEVPVNFYAAEDMLLLPRQLRNGLNPNDAKRDELTRLADRARILCSSALQKLKAGNQHHVYYLPLGVEFPFEHTTTADKFLYEAQLRTGPGAHFRYAKHLRDAANKWFDVFPATRPLVPLGEGEPE